MSRPVKCYVNPEIPVVADMIEEYGQKLQWMSHADKVNLIEGIASHLNLSFNSFVSDESDALSERIITEICSEEIAVGILRALTNNLIGVEEMHRPLENSTAPVLEDIENKFGSNLGLMPQSVKLYFAFCLARDLQFMWIGRQEGVSDSIKTFAQHIKEQITEKSEEDAIRLFKLFANSL